MTLYILKSFSQHADEFPEHDRFEYDLSYPCYGACVTIRESRFIRTHIDNSNRFHAIIKMQIGHRKKYSLSGLVFYQMTTRDMLKYMQLFKHCIPRRKRIINRFNDMKYFH